jgi:flagellar hook assembly protein FlgD
MNAGNHTVNWDGKDINGNNLKRGIYVCTLRTNSVITTKKLIRY